MSIRTLKAALVAVAAVVGLAGTLVVPMAAQAGHPHITKIKPGIVKIRPGVVKIRPGIVKYRPQIACFAGSGDVIAPSVIKNQSLKTLPTGTRILVTVAGNKDAGSFVHQLTSPLAPGQSRVLYNSPKKMWRFSCVAQILV